MMSPRALAARFVSPIFVTTLVVVCGFAFSAFLFSGAVDLKDTAVVGLVTLIGGKLIDLVGSTVSTFMRGVFGDEE